MPRKPKTTITLTTNRDGKLSRMQIRFSQPVMLGQEHPEDVTAALNMVNAHAPGAPLDGLTQLAAAHPGKGARELNINFTASKV